MNMFNVYFKAYVISFNSIQPLNSFIEDIEDNKTVSMDLVQRSLLMPWNKYLSSYCHSLYIQKCIGYVSLLCCHMKVHLLKVNSFYKMFLMKKSFRTIKDYFKLSIVSIKIFLMKGNDLTSFLQSYYKNILLKIYPDTLY